MLGTNFISKIDGDLFMRRAKRLGAFTDFGNGYGIVDMDIMNASSKRYTIAIAVITIGASVVGHILGSKDK